MSSLPRRLRSFLRLPAAERRLAVRAFVWLAAMRVALHVVPFTHLRAWIEGRGAIGTTADREWPLTVRRAMERALRTLPGSGCLAQSLVAALLLRRGGHPVTLTIGVAGSGAAPGASSLDAHAWVESGGVVVAGDDGREQYRHLVSFGADR